VRFAGDVMQFFAAPQEEIAYSPQERKEDQDLLRVIQRGEIGPVPQQKVDELIRRISGFQLPGV
jgi:hypothetical protein